MDTGRRTAVIEIGLTPCTNISGITDAPEFVNLIDTASSKKKIISSKEQLLFEYGPRNWWILHQWIHQFRVH